MIALAIILGVLVLLALMPVGIRAVFDTDLTVWLTVLGIKIQLFPGKDAPKKKKQKKEAEQKKSKKNAPKRDLQEYLQLFTRLLGKLHRKLQIRELTLHAVFGSREPELNYGRAWAAIGGITPILEENFRIRKRDIGAFLSEEESDVRILARAHAVMTLASILHIALHALRGWLKLQKPEKAV